MKGLWAPSVCSFEHRRGGWCYSLPRGRTRPEASTLPKVKRRLPRHRTALGYGPAIGCAAATLGRRDDFRNRRFVCASCEHRGSRPSGKPGRVVGTEQKGPDAPYLPDLRGFPVARDSRAGVRRRPSPRSPCVLCAGPPRRLCWMRSGTEQCRSCDGRRRLVPLRGARRLQACESTPARSGARIPRTQSGDWNRFIDPRLCRSAQPRGSDPGRAVLGPVLPTRSAPDHWVAVATGRRTLEPRQAASRECAVRQGILGCSAGRRRDSRRTRREDQAVHA